MLKALVKTSKETRHIENVHGFSIMLGDKVIITVEADEDFVYVYVDKDASPVKMLDRED